MPFTFAKCLLGICGEAPSKLLRNINKSVKQRLLFAVLVMYEWKSRIQVLWIDLACELGHWFDSFEGATDDVKLFH